MSTPPVITRNAMKALSDSEIAEALRRALGGEQKTQLAKASAIAGRQYASPAELEGLYPYTRHSWRQWYYSGRLRGCLKPAGKRGRLLIPLDEAERVMREGLGETTVV